MIGLIAMAEPTEPSSLLHLSPLELAAWLTEQWREGTRQPESVYRLPVLVTSGIKPEGRTIVLRRVSEDPLELQIHTDNRSPKVRQLSDSPACLLVWYDPVARLQIQARGTTSLHIGDARAREVWEKLPEHNGRQYGQVEPPGSELPTPGHHVLPEKEDGWPRFCLVSMTIEEIEMLQLHRDGNTRCRLLRSPAGWRKVWIAP